MFVCISSRFEPQCLDRTSRTDALTHQASYAAHAEHKLRKQDRHEDYLRSKPIADYLHHANSWDTTYSYSGSNHRCALGCGSPCGIW